MRRFVVFTRSLEILWLARCPRTCHLRIFLAFQYWHDGSFGVVHARFVFNFRWTHCKTRYLSKAKRMRRYRFFFTSFHVLVSDADGGLSGVVHSLVAETDCTLHPLSRRPTLFCFWVHGLSPPACCSLSLSVFREGGGGGQASLSSLSGFPR